MIIAGLQKVSLVDYDGCVATTIFTAGCNFRCPFCHNAVVVLGKTDFYTEGEVMSHIRARIGLIDAVVISGGEPTIQPDLVEFIEKIKALGLKVKLDTNGTHPEVLKTLLNKNLIDYVAMDIKNGLSNYNEISGRVVDTTKIQESINLLKTSSIDYEFRTTLVEGYHTEKDIHEIGKLIAGTKKYFLQKFVDSGECISSNLQPINKETAKSFVEILKGYNINAILRGY